jgi:DNA-binding transcriptional ArsR family regulator
MSALDLDTEGIASSSFCVRQLKVLADRTRLSVLKVLMDGPKHVGDINAIVRVEQSLLSHHLKILRDAGLVTTTRDGKAILYHFGATIEPPKNGNKIDLGCCTLSFE